MAQGATPHYHNSGGAPRIEIGSREFQCIGALPPHDHPHVYLDMGDETEIVCPYCSTHYVFAPDLAPDRARPPEARYLSAPS